MTPQQTMAQVADLVFSSRRPLPDDRHLISRSFGLNHPRLSKEIEYQIFDSCWYSLAGSLLPYKHYCKDTFDYSLLVYFGENIMAGTYIMSQTEYPGWWADLCDLIRKRNYESIENFKKEDGSIIDLNYYLREEKVRNYFDACSCEGNMAVEQGFVYDYAMRRERSLIERYYKKNES